MTARVTKRKRPESVDAKYKRLTKRAIRRLPLTTAETRWLWDEKRRRMLVSGSDRMTTDPPKPPAVLDKLVDKVLAYRQKPKTKPAKTRQRKAKRARILQRD